MKHIIFSLLLLFAGVLRLSAQDEFESCSFVAEEAWGGDTTAMKKFLTTCGKIDTVSLDSLHRPSAKNPYYQTISMKLNNGKVFRSDSVFFVAEQMPEFPGSSRVV